MQQLPILLNGELVINFSFMKNLIYIFFISVLFISCDTPESRSFQRNLPEFKAVVVNGLFDIVLVQDSVNKIYSLNSGSENINTKLSDTSLIISNSNTKSILYPDYTPKIYLHFDTLKHIIINEPCSIISSNYISQYETVIWAIADYQEINLKLNNERFFFKTRYKVHCNLEICGNSNYMELFPYSATNIDASRLSNNRTVLTNYSIGNIKLFVDDVIDIENYEEANLYLYKKPNSLNINVSEKQLNVFKNF